MADTDRVNRCSFEGCGKPVKGRGLCNGHYRQWRLGTPLRPLKAKRPKGTPPVIEWDEKPCPVAGLPGPCFIFRGAKKDSGYGHVGIGRKTVTVHRYVWESAHGPIPAGMEVDHQCRTRACCNVNHLRVVTKQVNSTENSVSPAAANAAKTHCAAGHPFTARNTYRSRFGRVCRECHRLREKARRDRVKAGKSMAHDPPFKNVLPNGEVDPTVKKPTTTPEPAR